MSIPAIKVKKLFPNAVIPQRGTPEASGLDVCVHHFERVYNQSPSITEIEISQLSSLTLCTNDRVLIHTGISATVGVGFEIQVRPRSGNALKRGLVVTNSPGTIDSDFRGAICVIISNIGHDAQEIKLGEKIAQLVVCPVILSDVVEVQDLDQTERGSGGFGSTGN